MAPYPPAPSPPLQGRVTFGLMQRGGVSRFADFVEATPAEVGGTAGHSFARYSLLTCRQYKLCLTDRRPEAFDEWLGASVRLALCYADDGAPIPEKLPPGPAGTASANAKRKRRNDGALIYYAPGGKGCCNSLPQMHSATEVVLTMGPDGISEDAFGVQAATVRGPPRPGNELGYPQSRMRISSYRSSWYCHKYRVFALRLEATGRDGAWIPLTGTIQLTTRAHKGRRSKAGREAAEEPMPPGPLQDSDADAEPEPGAEADAESDVNMGAPGTGAGSGSAPAEPSPGGTEADVDLLALIDRLPLVDLQGLPPLAESDEEADRRSEKVRSDLSDPRPSGRGPGADLALCAPDSPEAEVFGDAVRALERASAAALSPPISPPDSNSGSGSSPDAPVPSSASTPYPGLDAFGEDGTRRWSSILDGDPLMPAEDASPDGPSVSPSPSSSSASGSASGAAPFFSLQPVPEDGAFSFMDPATLRRPAPPPPPSPPLPALWPPEIMYSLHAQNLDQAVGSGVLLIPPDQAKDLVVSYVSSVHRALLAHFPRPTPEADLESAPELGLLNSPASLRLRLDFDFLEVKGGGADTENTVRSILNFLRVVMGPVNSLPTDFCIIPEESIRQLLNKAHALIQSTASGDELPSIYIEWLIRKGIFDFMYGRHDAAIESLWNAWSELIRRYEDPENYDDYMDEAVCYQCFYLAPQYSVLTCSKPYPPEPGLTAPAPAPAPPPPPPRPLGSQMYANMRMNRLASAARDWKEIFKLLKETCSVNSHFWDVLFIARCPRAGPYR
eukprot:tig00000158_g10185.t2